MNRLLEIYEAQLEALGTLGTRWQIARRSEASRGPALAPAEWPTAVLISRIAPHGELSVQALREDAALVLAELRVSLFKALLLLEATHNAVLLAREGAARNGEEAAKAAAKRAKAKQASAEDIRRGSEPLAGRPRPLAGAARGPLAAVRPRAASAKRRLSEEAQPRPRALLPPSPTAGRISLIRAYALAFVECTPEQRALAALATPTRGGLAPRERDDPHLWRGFDGAVRLLTDFWRLPLPTSTDPFCEFWFDELGALASPGYDAGSHGGARGRASDGGPGGGRAAPPGGQLPLARRLSLGDADGGGRQRDGASLGGHVEDVSLFRPQLRHPPAFLRAARRLRLFARDQVLGERRSAMLSRQELALPAGLGGGGGARRGRGAAAGGGGRASVEDAGGVWGLGGAARAPSGGGLAGGGLGEADRGGLGSGAAANGGGSAARAERWHAVCALLYGSAAAFAQRKRAQQLREKMATSIALAYRSLLLWRRCAARAAAKAQRAAVRLQRAWRRRRAHAQLAALLARADDADADADADAGAPRGGARARGGAEAAAAAEVRELLRKRRHLVLARRRRVLRKAMALYPAYEAAVVLVQGRARVLAARRVARERREQSASFSRSLTGLTGNARQHMHTVATAFQRHVRRWRAQHNFLWAEWARVRSAAALAAPHGAREPREVVQRLLIARPAAGGGGGPGSGGGGGGGAEAEAAGGRGAAAGHAGRRTIGGGTGAHSGGAMAGAGGRSGHLLAVDIAPGRAAPPATPASAARAGGEAEEAEAGAGLRPPMDGSRRARPSMVSSAGEEGGGEGAAEGAQPEAQAASGAARARAAAAVRGEAGGGDGAARRLQQQPQPPDTAQPQPRGDEEWSEDEDDALGGGGLPSAAAVLRVLDLREGRTAALASSIHAERLSLPPGADSRYAHLMSASAHARGMARVLSEFAQAYEEQAAAAAAALATPHAHGAAPRSSRGRGGGEAAGGGGWLHPPGYTPYATPACSRSASPNVSLRASRHPSPPSSPFGRRGSGRFAKPAGRGGAPEQQQPPTVGTALSPVASSRFGQSTLGQSTASATFDFLALAGIVSRPSPQPQHQHQPHSPARPAAAASSDRAAPPGTQDHTGSAARNGGGGGGGAGGSAREPAPHELLRPHSVHVPHADGASVGGRSPRASPAHVAMPPPLPPPMRWLAERIANLDAEDERAAAELARSRRALARQARTSLRASSRSAVLSPRPSGLAAAAGARGGGAGYELPPALSASRRLSSALGGAGGGAGADPLSLGALHALTDEASARERRMAFVRGALAELRALQRPPVASARRSAAGGDGGGAEGEGGIGPAHLLGSAAHTAEVLALLQAGHAAEPRVDEAMAAVEAAEERRGAKDGLRELHEEFGADAVRTSRRVLCGHARALAAQAQHTADELTPLVAPALADLRRAQALTAAAEECAGAQHALAVVRAAVARSRWSALLAARVSYQGEVFATNGAKGGFKAAVATLDGLVGGRALVRSLSRAARVPPTFVTFECALRSGDALRASPDELGAAFANGLGSDLCSYLGVPEGGADSDHSDDDDDDDEGEGEGEEGGRPGARAATEAAAGGACLGAGSSSLSVHAIGGPRAARPAARAARTRLARSPGDAAAALTAFAPGAVLVPFAPPPEHEKPHAPRAPRAMHGAAAHGAAEPPPARAAPPTAAAAVAAYAAAQRTGARLIVEAVAVVPAAPIGGRAATAPADGTAGQATRALGGSGPIVLLRARVRHSHADGRSAEPSLFLQLAQAALTDGAPPPFPEVAAALGVRSDRPVVAIVQAEKPVYRALHVRRAMAEADAAARAEADAAKAELAAIAIARGRAKARSAEGADGDEDDGGSADHSLPRSVAARSACCSAAPSAARSYAPSIAPSVSVAEFSASAASVGTIASVATFGGSHRGGGGGERAWGRGGGAGRQALGQAQPAADVAIPAALMAAAVAAVARGEGSTREPKRRLRAAEAQRQLLAELDALCPPNNALARQRAWLPEQLRRARARLVGAMGAPAAVAAFFEPHFARRREVKAAARRCAAEMRAAREAMRAPARAVSSTPGLSAQLRQVAERMEAELPVQPRPPGKDEHWAQHERADAERRLARRLAAVAHDLAERALQAGLSLAASGGGASGGGADAAAGAGGAARPEEEGAGPQAPPLSRRESSALLAAGLPVPPQPRSHGGGRAPAAEGSTAWALCRAMLQMRPRAFLRAAPGAEGARPIRPADVLAMARALGIRVPPAPASGQVPPEQQAALRPAPQPAAAPHGAARRAEQRARAPGGEAAGGGEQPLQDAPSPKWEWHLLWIALHALTAPLPALWHELDAQADARAEQGAAGSAAVPTAGCGHATPPKAATAGGRAAPAPAMPATPATPATPASRRPPMRAQRQADEPASAVDGRAPRPPEAADGGRAATAESGGGGGSGEEVEEAAEEEALPMLGSARFAHAFSGEVLSEHPLLPAFRAAVAEERRRSARPRRWSHVAAWMQFAAPLPPLAEAHGGRVGGQGEGRARGRAGRQAGSEGPPPPAHAGAICSSSSPPHRPGDGGSSSSPPHRPGDGGSGASLVGSAGAGSGTSGIGGGGGRKGLPSHGTYYYNFETGQSCTMLPVLEAPAAVQRRAREALIARQQAQRRGAVRTGSSADGAAVPLAASRLFQLAAESAKTVERLEAATHRQAAADLSAHQRRVRWAALYYAPCPLADIFVAGYAFGVPLVREPELAWLPEFLISLPPGPPPGFVRAAHTEPHWLSAITGERAAAHPFDLYAGEVRRAVAARQAELLSGMSEYAEATAAVAKGQHAASVQAASAQAALQLELAARARRSRSSEVSAASPQVSPMRSSVKKGLHFGH